MTCGTVVRDSDLRRPYICRCEECDAQRALLDGHWFEQVLDAGGKPSGIIKCKACGLEAVPIRRGESLKLHAVYCYPDPNDDPELPWEAKELGIRTRSEALALAVKKDVPASLLRWIAPADPHAEEIKAMCLELIRAAATTLATGVPTRRLFIACRRALQRERRSLLGSTRRR